MEPTPNPAGTVDPLVPPLRDFLRRRGKGFRTRLVEIGYLLAGGRGRAAAELGACVELLHAGSLIVDDIQDGSEVRRGEPTLHRNHGLPVALNAGNWLYFAALDELGRSGLGDGAQLRAYRQAMRTLLLCHQGQGLDLATRVDGVPGERLPAMAQRITALKTGELMRFGATLGALGAGAGDGLAARVGVFGFEMGVALQMLDDRSGLTNPERSEKGAEDLALRRVTWPWVWAFEGHGEELVGSLQRALRREEPIDAIAERLREASEGVADQSIHNQLQRSREAAAALGASAGLEALDAELARLEGAYG